jgi:hypothetical protein
MLDLLSKLIRPANIHAIVNGAIVEATITQDCLASAHSMLLSLTISGVTFHVNSHGNKLPHNDGRQAAEPKLSCREGV